MKLEGCVQSDVQNTSCKTANLIIPEGTDVNDSKQMKRHRLYLHLNVWNHLMEGEIFGFLPLNKRAMRKSVTSTNSFTAIVEQFSL